MIAIKCIWIYNQIQIDENEVHSNGNVSIIKSNIRMNKL